MLILSLDTAGRACAAGLWRNGEVLAEASERMERGQDSRLVPLVREIMVKAQIDFPTLDRIAVTTGPGSFTGIRIGLATARGFGLAAKKPVIGIDRFSLFRAQQKAEMENLLIVLDSKREELFCRLYKQARSEIPVMLSPEQIAVLAERRAPLTIAGDANEILRPYMPDAVTFAGLAEPESVTAASLAAEANPDDPTFLPRPFYLRAPDVTEVKAVRK